jgi:Fur family transcriptional regulator, ferric uptake regulator
MITQRSLRMTAQRKVILEELTQVNTHPTAPEIHSMVRRRLPHISLGTVYRNLDLLCEQGLVLRLPTQGGKQNRFDGDTKAHAHVHCTECGRVVDLLGMFSHAEMEDRARRESGYHIVSHRLEFVGVCPLCRAKVTI